MISRVNRINSIESDGSNINYNYYKLKKLTNIALKSKTSRLSRDKYFFANDVVIL